MRTVLRGRMLHCLDNPAKNADAIEFFENGVLVVEDGKIVALLHEQAAAAQGLDLSGAINLGSKLVVPGFIDTHVHAPQMDVIASYGTQLLEWLEQYTFPAEMRFSDPEFAQLAMQDFIQRLLRSGTTSAMVFSTSHEAATDLLFREAQKQCMCMIAGKVLMDRNAPAELCDSADSGYTQSKSLIEKWHGVDRLSYAVTPRFSITSTPAQLQRAGQLMTEFPGVYMQTHLSENLQEINTVKNLFPDADSYLDTYDQFGLCGERSFFAHGVHLEEIEVERLAATGSKVAFCPSSNLFLGSGLFNWHELEQAGVGISLASDVGGGLSLCMLPILCDAYKVCQLRGKSLTPMEAFYSATLGNARALGLEASIGNLAVGSDADLVVIDPTAQAAVAERVAKTNNIEDEWFACMMLGDEQLVSEVWVAGKRVVGGQVPGSKTANGSLEAAHESAAI